MTFVKPTGREVRRVVSELRADEKLFQISGYAAVHNTLSHNLGGFREQLKPGTFARSIREKADVKCLFNHEADNILGRTKSGTLTLSSDAHGLFYRCQLNKDSQAHRDLFAAISRGDIDECSFAFTCSKDGQKWEDGKDPETGEPCAIRTITDVDLMDVSPVTYPAYPGTAVGARTKPSYGTAATRNVSGDAADTLIAAALIEARELLRELRAKPYAEKHDATAMDELFATCARFQAAAYACHDLISDTLATWDTQDDDDDRGKRCPFNHPGDEEKNFRACHADTCKVMQSANRMLAASRLKLARWLTKKYK